MENVLITGSSGFLGSMLKASMEERKNNVISLGTKVSNDIICDLSLTQPHLSRIDLVIHAAGKAHSVPKSKREEKEFYDVNFVGTKNLCNAIDKLKNKPKAFIFISSVSVYGLSSGELINEEYPLLGITPYAKSKILAEEFLKAWAMNRKIILGILRLPLIAGHNPPGNLGAMINGIKTGKYLSIGEAKAKKSIVLANDVASILPKLSEVGGIYNLTDGYHPSFRELENVISKSLKKSSPMRIPLSVAKLMARLGDILGEKAPITSNKLEKLISSLTFDDHKAKAKLGWSPSKVLNKIPEIIN